MAMRRMRAPSYSYCLLRRRGHRAGHEYHLDHHVATPQARVVERNVHVAYSSAPNTPSFCHRAAQTAVDRGRGRAV